MEDGGRQHGVGPGPGRGPAGLAGAAPPEAIRGTSISARTASIISMSKPSVVPSASIELSSTSPAPRSTASLHQAMASSPAERVPPKVVTPNPEGCPGSRRASRDSTITWLPNRSAISPITSGRAIAPVLMPTLSAPQRSRESTSATERTPPPTVSGMKTVWAHLVTISRVVARPSVEAEMSRKVSSSAPSSP